MATTGLRSIECRRQFAFDVAAVHKSWTTTGKTAAKRAQAIVDSANRLLALGRTPAVDFAFRGMTSRFAAYFAHDDWRVDLDRRGFDTQKPPSLREMSELADSVYHECRHAEQWFLVARFVTNSGAMTPEELGAAGLDLAVAQMAATLPLKTGSAEEELAIRFTRCLVANTGNERLMQTQKDLETLSVGSKASPKEKKDAKDRLVKLGYIHPSASDAQVRRAAHRAYQYQFAEADAWDTGRMAKEMFVHLTCRIPPPVPVPMS